VLPVSQLAPRRLALQAVTPEGLAAAVPGLEVAEARKIVSCVHRDLPLPASASWIRRGFLGAVRARGDVPTLDLAREQRSSEDPFVKLALRLPDGPVVETVRIPLEKPGRFSVCVSSQAGCALACSFCATGRLGLTRNLEPWEIVEQVRAVRRTLDASRKERVHGVVFQGMGEPLANLERVLAAIAVLSDPSALAIDARNVTVCTSGIPAGILRLAEEAPRVRLGISIGSARPEVRRRLMPIDLAHPLATVLDAAAVHARATGLSPMWAVTLLAGVNDGPDDATALAGLATEFARGAGQRPRISVIPYNAIAAEGDPFSRSSPEAEERFRDALRAGGFASHRRYSGGADVAAACGQLVGSIAPRDAQNSAQSHPSGSQVQATFSSA
jgi:23S rRNA (adenine2503-C2)-methyltransferase